MIAKNAPWPAWRRSIGVAGALIGRRAMSNDRTRARHISNQGGF
jgi:hypothetical protein